MKQSSNVSSLVSLEQGELMLPCLRNMFVSSSRQHLAASTRKTAKPDDQEFVVFMTRITMEKVNKR